ncbi:DUF397 domain-containing protein [Streptomyces albospinus]|uniref:DUF397 domain-containing protein n=1 Tax=Streptomyces albospinus TaxID=285515 RepID=UPI0016707077|nr:DUF397 domain-containing protein [Streptomyces albospinus]
MVVSSYSDQGIDNCIEDAGGPAATVPVRDTRTPSGAALPIRCLISLQGRRECQLAQDWPDFARLRLVLEPSRRVTDCPFLGALDNASSRTQEHTGDRGNFVDQQSQSNCASYGRYP